MRNIKCGFIRRIDASCNKHLRRLTTVLEDISAACEEVVAQSTAEMQKGGSRPALCLAEIALKPTCCVISGPYTGAGIPSGLVRMSVGITGTLEQRWAQLRESFLAASSGLAKAGAPAVRSIDAMAQVQAHKAAVASQPPPEGRPHKLPRTEGAALA